MPIIFKGFGRKGEKISSVPIPIVLSVVKALVTRGKKIPNLLRIILQRKIVQRRKSIVNDASISHILDVV